MEKVFEFIKSLTPNIYDVLGYPTIKVSYDYVEVYFEFTSTIRDLSLLQFSGPDSFRMFPTDGIDSITIVYSFDLCK